MKSKRTVVLTCLVSSITLGLVGLSFLWLRTSPIARSYRRVELGATIEEARIELPSAMEAIPREAEMLTGIVYLQEESPRLSTYSGQLQAWDNQGIAGVLWLRLRIEDGRIVSKNLCWSYGFER